MKRFILISIVLASIALPLFAAESAPVALVFPVTPGAGALPDQAKEATRAMKTYLRDSGRLEVTTYDPESAMIQRAIQEHRIKAEDLVGTSSPETRLNIGKLLGVDFVVAGELKYGADITISLWLANVQTRKIWGFDGQSMIPTELKKELAVSNAIQLASARVVSAAVDIALKDVKPVTPTTPATGGTDTTVNTNTGSEPDEGAQKHVALAEGFVKAGDLASAILEYRRAVDAEPKNMDLRIKLADTYVSRKMFAEAKDELERAVAIDPNSEALKQAMARVDEASKAPTTTTTATTTTTTRTPPKVTPGVKPGTVASKIAAGDQLWQNQKLEEAEAQYRAAVAADGMNILASERLALLMAAMGRFDGAKAEVERMRQIDPTPDPKVAADRYARIETYVLRHIKLMLNEYDSKFSLFTDRSTTREDYYQQAQALTTRVESLLRLNDTLIPPDSMASAYKHQSLGLSLFSQACGHLINYLESNKSTEKDSAVMMLADAKKHLLNGGK